MRVTIGQVAKAAGVSITTVSRFINGQYRNMSDGTRQRLQDVVQELGYIPSSAAQSLKSGRTKIIGVSLSNIAHSYWASVLAGVEEACRQLGYTTIITNSGDDRELEDDNIRIMLNKQVDGLLLNPTGHNLDSIRRLPAMGCPVVTLDRTVPGLAYDLVSMDNLHGAKLAVNHLLAQGHRRIGFVSWKPWNLSNRVERVQGYMEALREAGLQADERYVAYADGTWADGIEKTIALVSRSDRPTAVFCASSVVNLQVLTGLKKQGLRVPDDVSVVGFDDSIWDALLDPPLTTVATPAQRLGSVAVKQLVRLIEKGAYGGKGPQAIRLRPRLIIRSSTKEVVQA